MTPDQLSQTLFIILFLILGAAWAAALLEVLRKSAAAGRAFRILLWAALAWNLVALIHRGIAADHAPWSNQYESATMVAFGIILLYGIFDYKKRVPLLGVFVIPVSMVVIAAASLLPEEYKKISPLMPALQSYWLKIHVSLMLISYGAFATTFGLSLLYLIKSGAWSRRHSWIFLCVGGALAGLFFAYVHAGANSEFWQGLMKARGWSELSGDKPKAYAALSSLGLALGAALAFLIGFLPSSLKELLPEAETLDELNYQSVALGFPLLTLGVILGAFWGHVAWGRYWAWDPKETWAFISWLIFAFYLHMRIFAGWAGKRIAWIGLIGAGSIVFTYWGVNFLLSGLHAYAKGS